MMKVIGWRVWYADGSKCDSAATKWKDLPDDGVLIIVLYFDEKRSDGKPLRRINSGVDWYFRVKGPKGFIYGQNNDTPEENKKRYGKDISLKRGKWADDATMQQAEREASGAIDCPCSEVRK